MAIHGIVLAGGSSRRMNGPDKAFVDFAGRPMLAHVLERLAPQCAGLVVSRNGDAACLAAFGLPVVADERPGAGPVGGLVAALDWLAEHRRDCVAAVSCAVDTPFVPRDFVERLRATPEGAVACASSDGRRHPVAGLWPVAVRHRLRQALEDGEHRVSALLDRLGFVEVVWQTVPVDPFFNVNRPEDLHRARELAALLD